MSDIIVQGWDLSLNHAGVIELKNGQMSNFWFICNKKSVVKSLGEHGIFLDYEASSDPHVTGLNRLFAWNSLLKTFFTSHYFDYLAVEDYAFGQARGSYQMGEGGAVFRMAVRETGVPFRLLDPLSVKMYTSGTGLAKKDQMEKAVLTKYGQDFSQHRKEVKEDLVDAFAIAKMCWTEYQLRNGLIQLPSLSEKEIQVFNRTTKMYPINILGREWIR